MKSPKYLRYQFLKLPDWKNNIPYTAGFTVVKVPGELKYQSPCKLEKIWYRLIFHDFRKPNISIKSLDSISVLWKLRGDSLGSFPLNLAVVPEVTQIADASVSINLVQSCNWCVVLLMQILVQERLKHSLRVINSTRTGTNAYYEGTVLDRRAVSQKRCRRPFHLNKTPI